MGLPLRVYGKAAVPQSDDDVKHGVREINKAAAEDQPLPIRERDRSKRKPLPDHLPRQAIVHEPVCQYQVNFPHLCRSKIPQFCRSGGGLVGRA
jgi:hypothetical protein